MPICNTCCLDKPLDQFAKDSSRKTGYKTTCKQCRAEKARIARAANPDHYHAIQHKSYQANREKRIAYDRKREQKRKAQKSAYMRQYYLDHLEAFERRRQDRRRRIKNTDGVHTADDIKRQYKAQKGRCYWCHKALKQKFNVDHIVPLSRGGSNAPDNLVVACEHCNKSRRNKLPHEWPEGGHLL